MVFSVLLCSVYLFMILAQISGFFMRSCTFFKWYFDVLSSNKSKTTSISPDPSGKTVSSYTYCGTNYPFDSKWKFS